MRNYQAEMERVLSELDSRGEVPRLLLHSCCAPCSSYVLECLSEHFCITVFYYNPNIYPDEEYVHRVKEQQEFIRRFPAKNEMTFLEGAFDKDRFYEIVRGMEELPEGGERCFACYRLRLTEAAEKARDGSYDFFTTTLSISPRKNAAMLNQIGEELAERYGVSYLVSDFKKKDGYKRSCELSREYGMYRQDYCGCVYSKRERENGNFVGRAV